MSQPNAIYFPEGAGYLLVEVLQSRNDCPCIENNVMLVRSLEDNKLYIRKTISLTSQSLSGIPNEIEFNPSFHLIPCVKDITKYMDKQSGEYYWAICTEYCNVGDLRSLLKTYDTEAPDHVPEPLIWKFIADMIEILGFLREHKILHSDIYPQNIFMRCDPEKRDTLWPDFVLGDFGWAVAMDDKNFRKDRWLFLQLLWDLCVSEECNIQLCKLDHRHLSEKLRMTVKYLWEVCMAAEPNVSWTIEHPVPQLSIDPQQDTLDWMIEKVLPSAKFQLEKWNSGVKSGPSLDFPAACVTHNNGKSWPKKINGIIEDWQIVEIIASSHCSDKITINGLARTTHDGSRKFPCFIKTCPGSIDVNDVYRFDADGVQLPPVNTMDSVSKCDSAKHMLCDHTVRIEPEDWELEALEEELPHKKSSFETHVSKAGREASKQDGC